MKTPRFIKAGNLPPQGILSSPVLWWLFLDRMDAPGWVWGAMGLLLLFITVVSVWTLFAGEAVDLLGKEG
jgi:hypothetical protein